jgi:hypothetical protein
MPPPSHEHNYRTTMQTQQRNRAEPPALARFWAGVAQTTRDRDGDFSRKRLFLLDVSDWFPTLVAALHPRRKIPLSPRDKRLCRRKENRIVRAADLEQRQTCEITEATLQARTHTHRACPLCWCASWRARPDCRTARRFPPLQVGWPAVRQTACIILLPATKE